MFGMREAYTWLTVYIDLGVPDLYYISGNANAALDQVFLLVNRVSNDGEPVQYLIPAIHTAGLVIVDVRLVCYGGIPIWPVEDYNIIALYAAKARQTVVCPLNGIRIRLAAGYG